MPLMPDWIVPALLVVVLVLLLWVAFKPQGDVSQIERVERELRDELGRQGQATRSDLGNFQQMLLAQSGDVARTQNEQIDSFRAQLAAMQTAVAAALQSAQAQQAQTAQSLQGQQASSAQAAREAQDAALRRFGEGLGEELRRLAQAQQQQADATRNTLETRLAALQQGNEARLEQMRATVDEKLHATLEQRLGESFRQVAERLEQVHKGLGEMQTLARDVGSLNRLLTNVKTRGIVGEMQLAGLLEQVFTPDQYAANVATVPGSNERVEFAIKLPGSQERGGAIWLPIDAKFPREDYERLLDAQERGDPAGADVAAKAIETRLRVEARSIQAKYVAAPHTTDFAILFLPTEGLYAEALRRPGLMEALQREHKVVLSGPTTLLAMLSSLQMGFRTLALERRSAEVWEVLGAVKTEFGKFGDVLARTKKKLDEASKTIDDAAVRTRAMERRLRGVEALPQAQAQSLLPGLVTAAVEEDDDAQATGADQGRPLA
jgi:DNA recombination protein RmuC